MDIQSELTPKLSDLYKRIPRRGPLSADDAVDSIDTLMRMYSQPHRHYHNLQHVLECLTQFEDAQTVCEDPVAVEMALWYHDLVYDPGEATNERLSANKAKFDCMRMQTEQEFAENVCSIILATTHAGDPIGDEAMAADIDLTILASPWERFSEYEKQIREEYSIYDDKLFNTSRMLFLDNMLRRPRIFVTDHFHDKCEGAARANIGRSLMAMRSKGA